MTAPTHALALPLLAATLLASVGCYQNTAPLGGQYDEARAYSNVTLSQDSLQQALGFQEPVVSRTDNDLMRVSVPLRARSNDTLHVEYRVIWFDEDGQPIPPEQSWTPLRLEPRQPYNVTANASSTDADNYNLQLRWARP